MSALSTTLLHRQHMRNKHFFEVLNSPVFQFFGLMGNIVGINLYGYEMSAQARGIPSCCVMLKQLFHKYRYHSTGLYFRAYNISGRMRQQNAFLACLGARISRQQRELGPRLTIIVR